ncbi:MAG: asparagine--tRNA ligase [Deltaproteobacteria bacterium]|uniref:Asparagine--tRNA ligase n=1 Tax=Candidatus Zymogenus saltonus TaxID=2844893 RepID=A0A9D8KBN5_9DELT|nr:asparagine--tRNA ligase [Candidatus Zymogenus saltonus]
MAEFTSIKYFKDNVGKSVTIRGWLMQSRGSGKVRFLIVRDGTGITQCVVEEDAVGTELFDLVKKFGQESALEVTGTVSEEPRAEGGFELHAASLKIIGESEEFPITPKSHGADFLLTNRHLWLRSRRQLSIMRIRDEVVTAIREFFRENDFVLIDTPILTGAIGESAGTLFSTQYFDLGNAYLAQTGQLYLEAAIYAFEKVYCFGPTFRAEKSKTRRHLTEFWMTEGEMAFVDNDGNMDFQERLVSFVVKKVLDRKAGDLEVLKRDTARLEKVTLPFERISYDEAVKLLKGKGKEVEWGKDLGGEDETILTKLFTKPVFVYDYPKRAKAFYMKQHPEREELVKCSDLLAPEGYGEIIGGSEREDDYDRLLARIREENLPEEAYGWYLDLRRYGSVKHSGFGLGVERTVAWICGIEHLREAIPFPRMMGRIYP